ncbi:MAG: HAD hydrolase-like protein [Roseiarcus sp.]
MTSALDAFAERVARARAAIFDMDGTLVLGAADGRGFEPLPGALELLALLRKRAIPLRVFTNGTAKTPRTYAANLRQAGLEIADSEMMTPATSAADWFVARGVRRVRVLGTTGAQEPLREAGLDVVGPSETASNVEAVFTGWHQGFAFADLEAACRDVWAGAALTTASNVPFYAVRGGRAIGVSFAINRMIGALTGRKARVLGKPSRVAIACALRQMGVPRSAAGETIVIGDDPALEMRMARTAGAAAIAVTTGLADNAAFERAVAAERPDIVLDGLGWIVGVLR